MSLRAILSSSTLAVDPGSKVSAEVEVANTGEIVEDFRFEVVGPAAAWATVEPAEVALFPGDSGKAKVIFAPPRHPTTRAAELPFGVKVTPVNEPGASVVEEGRLTVTRFVEVSAEVMPEATRGKFHGKLGVVVDSLSNVPTVVALRGQDATGRLGVRAKPASATIGPGEAALFKVKVKPHHKIIRGTAQSHRYKLVAEPEGGDPVKKDATHMQRSVLPRGSLPIAGLAIVALVVLMLLRPQPASTAVTSTPSLAASASSTSSTSKSLGAASTSSTAASHVASTSSTAASHVASSSTTAAPGTSSTTSAPGSTTTTAPSSSTTTTTVPAPNLPAPFGQTLEVVEPAGSSGQASYTVPSGETLQVGELLFENLQPDAGAVRVELQPPASSGGSKPPLQDLFFTSLSNLGFQTLSFSQQPVSVPSGWGLVVGLSCSKASSGSCDAGAFVSGQLTAASTSPKSRQSKR